MLLSTALVLALSAASASATFAFPAQLRRAPLRDNCGCPITPGAYMPVCSKSTGITYGSLCRAKNCKPKDEGPFHSGECLEALCQCANIEAPVCEVDTGTTYINKCIALCEEAQEPIVSGTCEAVKAAEDKAAKEQEEDDGDDDEDDEETNEVAIVKEDRIVKRPFQKPRKDCVCLQVYDPVCCVKTGRTFGNSCDADCSGQCPGGVVEGACGSADTEEAEPGSDGQDSVPPKKGGKKTSTVVVNSAGTPIPKAAGASKDAAPTKTFRFSARSSDRRSSTSA